VVVVAAVSLFLLSALVASSSFVVLALVVVVEEEEDGDGEVAAVVVVVVTERLVGEAAEDDLVGFFLRAAVRREMLGLRTTAGWGWWDEGSVLILFRAGSSKKRSSVVAVVVSGVMGLKAVAMDSSLDQDVRILPGTPAPLAFKWESISPGCRPSWIGWRSGLLIAGDTRPAAWGAQEDVTAGTAEGGCSRDGVVDPGVGHGLRLATALAWRPLTLRSAQK
jgi:hypothetical protein